MYYLAFLFLQKKGLPGIDQITEYTLYTSDRHLL
jgi:hypothetical protein